MPRSRALLNDWPIVSSSGFDQDPTSGSDLPYADFDFVTNRYRLNRGVYNDFRTLLSANNGTYTRASVATYFDKNGVLQDAPVNTLRFDYDPLTLAPLGILLEGDSRTNGIRNSTGTGATAGSPGVLPTSWFAVVPTGLTRSVVSVSVINGIECVRLRFAGTATASGNITVGFENSNVTPALTGQTWTGSVFHALASGTLTGLSTPRLTISENNSSGTFVAGNLYPIATPTSSSISTQRQQVTRLLNGGATIAFILQQWSMVVEVGVAVDVTLDFGLPQLEQGAYASSPIRTSSIAVTRAGDIAPNIPYVQSGEHTLYAEARQLFTGTQLSNMAVFSVENTASERTQIRFTSNSRPVTTVFDDGVLQAEAQSGTTYSSFAKMASSVGVNDVNAYVNGTSYLVDTSVSLPTTTQIRIGQAVNSMNFMGHIKRVIFYQRKLSAAEVVSIDAAPAWATTGSTLSIDNINQRYFSDSRSYDSFASFLSGVNGTFLRASGATYFDKDGILRDAAVDVPRFNYDPVTKTPKGLLQEPQRTNSIRNNTFVGVAANTLPAGMTIGGGLGLTTTIIGRGVEQGLEYAEFRFQGTPTFTEIYCYLDSPISVTAGQVYTNSIYIRQVGGSDTNILGMQQLVVFRDAASATLAAPSSTVTPISTAPAGQDRKVQILTAPANSTSAHPRFDIEYTANVPIDITIRVYLPQFELGSSESSPIKTSGAAATRAAETFDFPVGTWWNDIEGTIIHDGTAAAAANNTYLLSIDKGPNVFGPRHQITYGESYSVVDDTGAVAVNSMSSGGVRNKAAIGYKLNDFAISSEGIAASVDTTGTPPTAMARVKVGRDPVGGRMVGHTRRLEYLPVRKSNAELQTLSTVVA